MTVSSLVPVAKPLPPVSVTFLGTCSGGGPIISRNCSSLAVDFGNDIWLFDAADGTLPRLHQSPLKLTNITRIFITHLHADHVLGLVSTMTTIMSGIGTTPDDLERLKAKGTNKQADINIYGTKGLRKLIRTTLEITSVTLAGAYAVHELLYANEADASVTCNAEELHVNEAVGKDIRVGSDGVWRDIMREGEGKGGRSWGVAAGPIEHRVNALGYVLQEPLPRLPLDTANLIPILQSNATALAALDPPVKHPLSLLSHLTSLPVPDPYTLPSGETLHPPGPSGIHPRKLVIFGDCSGGTSNPVFEEMCQHPSLLIHECTNSAVPELVQRGEKGRKVRMKGMDNGLVKRSEEQTGKKVGHEGPKEDEEAKSRAEREITKVEEVRKKAQKRGHSTPAEVGEFARRVQARRVIVNHFSAMFPSPRYPSSAPAPSLLSRMSPFPYPTPWPVPRSPYPLSEPLPLNGAELHIRLILQALADQITAVWHAPATDKALNGDSDRMIDPLARAIPARDFMVVRVLSHELTDSEKDEAEKARIEAEVVLQSWKADGGAWLEEENERHWVGVEAAPQ